MYALSKGIQIWPLSFMEAHMVLKDAPNYYHEPISRPECVLLPAHHGGDGDKLERLWKHLKITIF
jgi:hypothetical protein